jgi:hypothetical protein
MEGPAMLLLIGDRGTYNAEVDRFPLPILKVPSGSG